MHKLNKCLIVFLLVWAVLGTVVFLFYPYFPVEVDSAGKELNVTVATGRSYYVLAFAPQEKLLPKSLQPDNVLFAWKESGGNAKAELLLEKSSFKTRVEKGGETVKHGAAILKFTAKRSGTIVVSCRAAGSFTLAVWSSFSPLIVVLSATFVGALIIAIIVYRRLGKK
ncbi:MAG: hypothetical protein HZA89_13635 [Verrucomicrobia bacterium]|nr:hypothetical protein [Verrucomicrobiota bacterium]